MRKPIEIRSEWTDVFREFCPGRGTGVQKIPVSMDSAPFEAFTVAVDEQAKEVLN